VSASASAITNPGQASIHQLFPLSVSLGLALTDANAALSDASRYLSEQTQELGLTETSLGRMVQSSATTAERLAAVSEAAAEASAKLAEAARSTLVAVKESKVCASNLASTANEIDVQAMAAESQVSDLKRSSDGIHKIAREIQMLAVNAGVEAARHGAAGRGFAVIAEAIKGLADQTRLATEAMGKHLNGLGATVGSLHGCCQENLEHARRMDDAALEAARQSTILGTVQNSVTQVASQLGQAINPIVQLARTSQEISASMHSGSAQINHASQCIATSSDRLGDILSLSDAINTCLMDMKADLPISDLGERCKATAQHIGQLFEAAIKAGEIDRAGMFDEQYRLIEGTNPEQYTTRFTALTDKLLPDIQERLLTSDSKIVFCAAVDRLGYLPTHNRKFSQPQSDDPVWNAQHSRNRRFFTDRAGLASARNRNPWLFQSYRRDMGGGRFVVMSELASPILVGGRHWGGFRIGFQLAGGSHGRLG
jgi:methyl-accepting chemotaxis protein